jgi:hypothetical protein
MPKPYLWRLAAWISANATDDAITGETQRHADPPLM